jgi:aryl-alcohol dehydrogenase-like predicted oxidoreductase
MFGQWQYNAAEERASTPIEETLGVLADLVKAGKIRAVGLSNEHPWGVMKFIHAADALGLPRVASVQNAYNLINRTFDVGLREVCAREEVSLLAYSPLAFGWLTGKYHDDPQAPGRVTKFAGFGGRYEKPGVDAAVRYYLDLARQNGLTPTQMALAWCYRRPSVTATIVGATSVTQLSENLDAAAVTLSDEVATAIDTGYLTYGSPAP